jgi:glycine/D-amino acid oxidase-like deaminating enzyme
MNRRDFLSGSGAAFGLGLFSLRAPLHAAEGAGPAPIPPVPRLARVNARTDRIVRITVCTRPFRPAGPRIEPETIGRKTVVHNYGHGGSGWSLSWGSSTVALQHAVATGEQSYAVIGCGALGLTSALLLQRAGKRVTIYAKEFPPEARSSRATGSWTPDSRVCLASQATPAFAKLWEEMCRTSYRTYQNLLGLPGEPVEWVDRYSTSTIPLDELRRRREEEEVMKFGRFQDLVKDLTPASEELPPGSHPFGVPFVRRSTNMIFNLTAYQRMLIGDFLAAGGRLETREFHSPADFAALPEKTIVNATGYGARALLGDESLVPVRGQLAALIPQPEVNYGLSTEDVSMVPRRDGIIVQTSLKSDYGNADTTPDRAETERGVQALAQAMARMTG